MPMSLLLHVVGPEIAKHYVLPFFTTTVSVLHTQILSTNLGIKTAIHFGAEYDGVKG